VRNHRRMTDAWVRYDELSELDERLQLDSQAHANATLEVLAATPGSGDWFFVRSEYPEAIPGITAFLIPRTRIYFNATEAKKVWGDLGVLAAAYAATGSTSTASAIALVKKLIAHLHVLSDEEGELVRVIAGIARPHNPYSIAVPEVRIHGAYEDADVDINGLLDALERKSVIRKERVGRVRLVL
jgi:hypothetical protein